MLKLVDVSEVADAVGAAAYGRGIRYAQQQAVVRMAWDATENALRGTVRGQHGDLYATTAYFSFFAEDAAEFEHGECDCPVGFNCKHVAALVVTAMADTQPERASKPRLPAWERSLDSVLESPLAHTGGAPLAIAVTLADPARTGTPGGAAVRVLAKLVTPGRNGWVNGGLSWSRLSSGYHDRDHPAEHVRLLREMYSLYRSTAGHRGYYGDEKSIELSAFGSRQLWPLLDEADAIGLRLVHGRKQLGDVAKYRSADLILDITRDEPSSALAVTPVIKVDGSDMDAAPIRFIGPDGHGVVYIDRAEVRTVGDPGRWHIHLARMTRAVPAELRRIAVDRQRVEIPAADQARFRQRYYPRLSRTAVVISSDGTFPLPEISPPTLVAHAAYGPGHALDVTWEWSYQVGGSTHRTPLIVTGEDGYRDGVAERAVLDGLDLPLDLFGLLSDDPELPIVPGASYRGIDTMRFTTELLPLLAGRPDATVEITGTPADYHEAGDTLAIAVSTDDVAGDTDWFDLGVRITVEGRAVPFADVFVALSTGQSHLLLADGAYFSLDKPELRTLASLIDEARALGDAPAGGLRISRFQAGLWGELAALGVVDHQAQAWQRQVEGLLAVDSVDQTPVPDSLTAQLRPYQVEGYRWLAFLWRHQLGGVLADDMGLGKTLQSLALLCHARQVDPDGAPFLIVAPTSVLSNWAAESARFAPGLTVAVVSDTLRRRGRTLDEIVAGADVVITSYTLLRLDFDGYGGRPWSGLVLDEAQHVKNHQSKGYQCARRLPAAVKFAITGTPMENNLMELWSLLSITAPGLFPSPTRFREYYAQPIEKQRDAELLARLRRRMRPLVRRRTKEQVAADLPAKQEQVLEVELHPRHRKLYQTHLQLERQKVLGLIDDVNRNRFTILRSLTVLRQLSLHAGLVDEEHRDLPSAKIDALAEQVREVVDGGHRALVFSQFTGFLGQVRARLDTDGVEYCYLDGRTRKRGAVLERFKEGAAPVFLISLKAGGFGLNLTEADYCFLLDPWWNPATEAQAVDRTHRIGQTRNVMVYRLIAKGTIEEKVMALKERKAALFRDVMDDGDAFGSTLGADDIRELFA
jgi:superfamily II DNA or RNA helicase